MDTIEPYNKPIDIENIESDGKVCVGDLPDEISNQPGLQELAEVEIPQAIKPQASSGDMIHREFDAEDFWRKVPEWRGVSRKEFLDWRFQNKHSVTRVDKLCELVKDLAPAAFLDDVKMGMIQAPMNIRISPYLLSLIDWDNPYEDPLRIQFIPVASRREADHPRLKLDSLCEQDDSPVKGLVHRYPGKALFLPLDICPVYCRFCTRSYAIGQDTDTVEKTSYRMDHKRWEMAFAYLASRPEVEDVVISGGDTYMLPPKRLKEIGEILLSIPHIRRIRIASKGPAVMPMKILSHHEWTEALAGLVELGRSMNKEVCLHTHFNSPGEITSITRDAMNLLFQQGVKVRNQSVMIRGVNDNAETMTTLVRQLSYMNVQPYYVYQHDMVSGVEDMRTRVGVTQEIERYVRGSVAGFNTPTFVNDVPGGGGKRDVHSYDYYDEETGVSVYRSPCVDEDRVYLYFDPIAQLPNQGKLRWAHQEEHQRMVDEALNKAGLEEGRVKI